MGGFRGLVLVLVMASAAAVWAAPFSGEGVIEWFAPIELRLQGKRLPVTVDETGSYYHFETFRLPGTAGGYTNVGVATKSAADGGVIWRSFDIDHFYLDPSARADTAVSPSGEFYVLDYVAATDGTSDRMYKLTKFSGASFGEWSALFPVPWFPDPKNRSGAIFVGEGLVTIAYGLPSGDAEVRTLTSSGTIVTSAAITSGSTSRVTDLTADENGNVQVLLDDESIAVIVSLDPAGMERWRYTSERTVGDKLVPIPGGRTGFTGKASLGYFGVVTALVDDAGAELWQSWLTEPACNHYPEDVVFNVDEQAIWTTSSDRCTERRTEAGTIQKHALDGELLVRQRDEKRNLETLSPREGGGVYANGSGHYGNYSYVEPGSYHDFTLYEFEIGSDGTELSRSAHEPRSSRELDLTSMAESSGGGINLYAVDNFLGLATSVWTVSPVGVAIELGEPSTQPIWSGTADDKRLGFEEWPVSMATGPRGEIATVGKFSGYVTSDPGDSSTKAWWVVRLYQPGGLLEWEKIFERNNSDLGPLAIASDGSVAFAESSSHSNPDGRNGYALVRKWSADGVLLWSRTYDDPALRFVIVRTLQFDRAGYLYAWVHGDEDGVMNLQFVSLDPSGEPRWGDTIKDITKFEEFGYLFQAPAYGKDRICSGTVHTAYGGSPLTMCVNKDTGDVLWSQPYHATALAIAEDGSVYSVGAAGTFNGTTGWSHWAVRKFSAAGEVVWSREMEVLTQTSDEERHFDPRDLTLTPAGVVVTGGIKVDSELDGQIADSSPLRYLGIVLIDSSGEVIFERPFRQLPGAAEDLIALGFDEAPDWCCNTAPGRFEAGSSGPPLLTSSSGSVFQAAHYSTHTPSNSSQWNSGILGIDVTPETKSEPRVNHTPKASAGTGAMTVTAEISDDTEVLVADLFYRPAGSLGEYDSVSMSSEDGLNFTGLVPRVGAPGVEYYIRASDGTGEGWSGFAAKPHYTAVEGAVADVNGDGSLSVADVFYLINHLFAGGPGPVGSGDANGDGAVSVADIFYLINYLFAGGPAPA